MGFWYVRPWASLDPGTTHRQDWIDGAQTLQTPFERCLYCRVLAKYQVQLFRHKFPAIGILFLSPSPESVPAEQAASQGTTEDSQNTKPSDNLLVNEETLNEASSNL